MNKQPTAVVDVPGFDLLISDSRVGVKTRYHGHDRFPPTIEVADQHSCMAIHHHTSFIGRAQELTEVSRLLNANRLLTLTGPGGVGKTRLALALVNTVGTLFPDGVYVISLASISDPTRVIPAIGAELELRTVDDGVSLAGIISFLQTRRVLLVLDNFEQVVDAAAAIADLLARCPLLTIVTTSRIPLHLAIEQEYLVLPLTLPAIGSTINLDVLCQSDAVNLFVRRAQQRKPDFTLTPANGDIVVAICRCVEGVPLALELAAARIKFLEPQALLERLERPLAVLTNGPRDAPSRQRTMRAAIAWSYDLLIPIEQRLFHQLTLFSGGWTLEAAEAVCSTDGDVFEGMAALVEHSLVYQIERPGHTGRFNMLETIREYGREQLEASAEADLLRSRHAAYFSELAEQAGESWCSPPLPALYQRLDEDHSNLGAALQWTLDYDLSTALQMVSNLWDYWWVRGYLSEGGHWLTAALEATTESPNAARAHALLGAGTIASDQGNFDMAARFFEQSLPLLEASDDRFGIAWVLRRMGWIACCLEDLERANALSQESLAIARECNDPWLVSPVLGNLAVIAQLQGNLERATVFGEEAVLRARQAMDRGGLAIQLSVLGSVMLQRGDVARAIAILREGLEVAKELGAPSVLAGYLGGFAAVAAAQGDFARSARLAGVREALQQRIGELTIGAQNPMCNRDIARAQTEADEASWVAAREHGLTMSIEQAMAYAIEPCAADALATSKHPIQLDGLTQRETEVLCLIAASQSNREIAEQLFLSPRTIERHIANIYVKIDVHSRSEATAYASSRHLA